MKSLKDKRIKVISKEIIKEKKKEKRMEELEHGKNFQIFFFFSSNLLSIYNLLGCNKSLASFYLHTFA